MQHARGFIVGCATGWLWSPGRQSTRCQLLNDVQGWVTPSSLPSPDRGVPSPNFPYLVPPREPTLRKSMAEAHDRAGAQLHKMQTHPRLSKREGSREWSQPAGHREPAPLPQTSRPFQCAARPLAPGLAFSAKTPNVRRKCLRRDEWPNCATEIGSFTRTRKAWKEDHNVNPKERKCQRMLKYRTIILMPTLVK